MVTIKEIKKVNKEERTKKYVVRYEDGTVEEMDSCMILEMTNVGGQSAIELRTLNFGYNDIEYVVKDLVYSMLENDSMEEHENE
ncbi:hypothetical protein U729_3126 (plasmid) [Clostridium baratii str. Sullivan]|uniref:Uncharacterized protein n=1 Tax=Clostridium baratii str. Sullivan TaxID=1415775 RepID=A0A0A7G2S1_9CLOT|nr:hypothetical protein [Clostridium baratii]AIY85286.1 hypothetical protein U729_3126 [Clostridium baratii str. Sullivan]